MYGDLKRRIIGMADTIKEDSVDAVRALQRMGIEVVMITGDNERTAQAIARRVGIRRVLTDVLPEEKAREVEKLQAEGSTLKERGGRGARLVGMVGDGINDPKHLHPTWCAGVWGRVSHVRVLV